RNFHGMNNFHRAGFNRNAFGNGHTWNRWGGRFWGAGWDNWGGGWGGWAGPVFWPYLYGDVFSFAFWPYDYYDPFFAFGPEFVLASIFAPGPYFGPDYYGYDNQSDVYYGATGADQRAMARTDAAAAQSCNGLAPGVTDLPIAQIRKTVQPTGEQLADLDALSDAAAKADSIVAGSCPNSIPLTPVARLDTAEQRLNTMIQAIDIVRDPLGKFYDSLSDEQRQRFDDMNSANGGRHQTSSQDLASLCSSRPGDVTALPVRRIQQVVQPDAQQQSAFDDLKKVSQDVAAKLQASCPTQMPKTPVARLDAVKTRLTAMVDAIDSVRPKLEAFYASLSDEQKAKFNTMGPPQSAAADSQGRTSDQ
ncbi:MAG: Spy/CpxP family protein refolding chaperone, partial [Hyphomicrobiales bacterium]|nr:Spy/CpxP family protein refolding chaperone [Hyphomicrobiales bacterium]